MKDFCGTRSLKRNRGLSENRGYLMRGPYSTDPTILGTIIRVPYFRKPPKSSWCGGHKGGESGFTGLGGSVEKSCFEVEALIVSAWSGWTFESRPVARLVVISRFISALRGVWFGSLLFYSWLSRVRLVHRFADAAAPCRRSTDLDRRIRLIPKSTSTISGTAANRKLVFASPAVALAKKFQEFAS